MTVWHLGKKTKGVSYVLLLAFACGASPEVCGSLLGLGGGSVHVQCSWEGGYEVGPLGCAVRGDGIPERAGGVSGPLG